MTPEVFLSSGVPFWRPQLYLRTQKNHPSRMASSFLQNWICMIAKSVWISPRPISIRQLHVL
uniref:hypothetical protein n=1 Tax=uncultured Brevibacillus sp. TaxID=169970 RepID=UPI0025951E49